MNNNNIFSSFQSGFKARHSTETALIKVTNDLLLTADRGDCSVLVLLDLSSAFDTVDHHILLHRLKTSVGIKGPALNLLDSYLKNRTFAVVVGNHCSTTAPINCSVPQGSILRPLLLSIYVLHLSQLIQHHGVSHHCYADNLLSCLKDVKSWMPQNFLKLNENKTEIISFGPRHPSNLLQSQLGPLSLNLRQAAKNLGVMFDAELYFDVQVKSSVKSCFFLLKQFPKLDFILFYFIFFIPVWLLHGFTCFYLLSPGLLQWTVYWNQSELPSQTRILTGNKTYHHITVVAALHWIPILFRIDFKIILLTFKSLNGLAPIYISDHLVPYVPMRTVRSVDGALLVVPRSRQVTKGDRAFAVRPRVSGTHYNLRLDRQHHLPLLNPYWKFSFIVKPF